jgi:NADH-quinone oxidoreductase subunit C
MEKDLAQYTEVVTSKLTSGLGIEAIHSEVQYDMVSITVPRQNIHQSLSLLKSDADLKLDFLTTLCGIHFPDNVGNEFCVMYQLHNMASGDRLRIKTYLPKTDLGIPTITDLWSAANWLERETFDFYGIIFTGHPNLKRIMNMDEMNYHPMRKEYALEDESRSDKEDKYFGR